MAEQYIIAKLLMHMEDKNRDSFDKNAKAKLWRESMGAARDSKKRKRAEMENDQLMADEE